MLLKYIKIMINERSTNLNFAGSNKLSRPLTELGKAFLPAIIMP